MIQPQASRLVQAGWLLFALFSLSLGAAGVSSYRYLLAVPCVGSDCLPGQFTPAEMELVVQDHWNTPTERAEVDTSMAILVSLLLAGSAALFVWQRSDQYAFTLGGFVFLALAAEPFVAALARTGPHRLWALRVLEIVHLAGLGPFLCLIPDDRFRPRGLRFPVLICILLGILIPLLSASQTGLRVSYSVLIVFVVVVSMITKVKNPADAHQREQLVWLVTSLLLLGVAQVVSPYRGLLPMTDITAVVPVGGKTPLDVFTSSFLSSTFLWAGAVVSLTVGLMRTELIQLEIILNRTMLYAILTLFVVGIYIAVIGYLSLIFQSSGSLVFSLIATGFVAVLFQPIRARAQRFVNQMLYGERDKPYAVLEQLGRELENAIAPQDLLENVVTKVRSALKLPYAAIALGADDRGDYKIVAEEGAPTGSPMVFPLVAQGEHIGQFILSPRSAGESFSATDRRLLQNLAGQVGIAAHTATLMMELQRAREKLVYTREEERLRLRRDLHDGLGTTLAALNLQVGNIRRLIPEEPTAADAAVLELRIQLRKMISEVRRLINDLRPKTLDEFGLTGAVQLLAIEVTANSGVQVSVDLPHKLPVLPPAVEVAAFRIIQESVTNVIKHATAQTCTIRLIQGDGLIIEILDDGIGLPAKVIEGKGLRTIRERASELGGYFLAENQPNGGSRLLVRLPLHGYDNLDAAPIQEEGLTLPQ
ncbi:MAG: GAF domain-containing sensor histidine kinase [Anaerolineales bacterium]|jgi:signal transduction histidine kinase